MVCGHEKARCGRKDGKGGLSPATLRQYKNIIYQTLNEAIKNGILQTNPCQFVELPKKQRYESSYYNADQLKALFDAICDDPIYPLVKITISTSFPASNPGPNATVRDAISL